jgi:predicted  nucleic acid-binding Zn-ribbon protein
MSRSATLLQLQSIDLELDAVQARLKAIEAALGDDPAVRRAQKAALEAHTHLQTARTTVQALEYEGQVLSEKMGEVAARMYGGAVTNPKELQDLQKETESLKRRREALEERQFEALVDVEAKEVAHVDLLRQAAAAEAAAAQAHGDLREERQALLASAERLAPGREAVWALVPAADRELYERLRQAKRGRAVSTLEDGACTACGVAPSSSRIQSARQGNELILCGNCGRILCAD